MRNGDLNIVFYKIMFCIILSVVFILTFNRDAYAARTSVSGVGNCINTSDSSANVSVSGVGNKTIVNVTSMQEAQKLIQTIKVSGVGNIVTINCYTTDVEKYLIDEISCVPVSGVQNTINIVLVPQASSQPQIEVQPTAQPQQPEVQSTMTPEIQPTNTPEVQPTTEPKKDTIPQPENKPTQSEDELDKSPKTGDESDIISVAIVLAVSFIFMIISGAYIIRHRRKL